MTSTLALGHQSFPETFIIFWVTFFITILLLLSSFSDKFLRANFQGKFLSPLCGDPSPQTPTP